MVAKPFVIDTRAFAKKGDAVAYFREMLNRYRPGDLVSEPDTLDLKALLKHHTEHRAKVGVGIGHICQKTGGVVITI